jgi:predicted RNase H-like HicB family nuclease
MRVYKFTVVFTPEKKKDGVYYNVTVPALPEIATFGESLEEARFMAQDAIELVVLSMLEEGEKIPTNKKPKKVTKSATVEDVLITVSHEVKSTPITPDVKAAFS